MASETKTWSKTSISENTNSSNKNLTKQADQTREDRHDDQNATAVNTIRPHLPDPIIHRILRLLPTTKSAIRMSFLSKQWECLWSLLFPMLDLDEGEPQSDDDDLDDKLQHTKFINFLQKCLEFCERDNKQVLDKFRLHMTMYLSGDATIADKWLSFVAERSVKEVDISLLRQNWNDSTYQYDYFCLPRTLVNAKSITSLNLKYVRIEKYRKGVRLPSLKTMALKTVKFNKGALSPFIRGCPFIDYLSLTSCSFDYCKDLKILVSSSSLKSLKVMCCSSKCPNQQSRWSSLTIEARNLESFTFVSNFPIFDRLVCYKCCNLKYIDIRAQYLKKFVLLGHQDGVEATINTPDLLYFTFSGYLNSKVSLEAPNLSEARIRLRNWEPTFHWSWEHFSTLRDFLEKFGGSERITLFVRDAEALIFPGNFRKTCSSPLPSVKELELYRTSPTPIRDSDIRNSLLWMAPSAKILPILYMDL